MPNPLSAALAVGVAGRSTADWLLGSLGVSVAAMAASFALYMLATAPGDGRRPAVSGDFNVFVRFDRRYQPATGPADAGTVPADAATAGPAPAQGLAPRSAARAIPPDGIDFTPTGSIAADRRIRADPVGAPAAGRRTPAITLNDFVIRDIFDGKAVVESRNKLHLVQPGSLLDDGGTVLAIKPSPTGWVIETTTGRIER